MNKTNRIHALPATMVTMFLLVFSSSLQAASSTWDSDGNYANGITDGSGTWSTAGTNWYATTGDTAWTSGDTAVFGSTGTGGTVTLSSSMTAAGVMFYKSGYTLTGSNLILTSTGTGISSSIYVASGVSAEIDNAFTSTASSQQTVSLYSGSTLTLKGGGVINTWNVTGATGTLVLASGTYGGANGVFQTSSIVNQGAATLNMVRILVGINGTSTYTVNDASAVINLTSTSLVSAVGRAGTGVLNLKNGTITSSTDLVVGYGDAGYGTLNVSGGTMTLKNTSALIIAAGSYSATTANESGIVNISGGVVYAPTVQFGSGTTSYTAGTTTAALNVSGGTLYVGSGGIVKYSNAPSTNTISLTGGTVGATANWTSTMAMALTGTNGNITFKTADASNASYNITLSGALSGAGGLTKTGAGILTLAGANTYQGGTLVSAGTLVATSLGTGNVEVANGAILTLQSASALGSTAILTLDGSSSLVNLDFTGTLYVNKLFVNGVLAGIGTFTAEELGSQFSGTGLISIAVPEPKVADLMAASTAFIIVLGYYRRRRSLMLCSK